jgi:hypothetical protein
MRMVVKSSCRVQSTERHNQISCPLFLLADVLDRAHRVDGVERRVEDKDKG